MAKIASINSIQVYDSRGNPTIRTFVKLDDGSMGSASVPSGASTGIHEAFELRDSEGSVLSAVELVNTKIKSAFSGFEADPRKVDADLIKLDGTDSKKTLGANSILSVSLALVRAKAVSEGVPLWKYLRDYYFSSLPDELIFPKLMVNIINGGKHASWNFDIQEFMVVPNTNIPSESIFIASNIFHALGDILKNKNLSTLIGDEGGYSPNLNSNEEVFECITKAAQEKGYENVKDYRFSVDCAASEFYKDGKYTLSKLGKSLNSQELTQYYQEIGVKNNILSFEDAFSEDDWSSFTAFQKMADEFHFLNIGDDLFTTNPKRIKEGIEKHAANGVIIKPNQIGTISETVESIRLAKEVGWKVVISHRSGDTEDSFIADLAVSCSADFFKSGSMSRSERLSKYNRLLEIECGL